MIEYMPKQTRSWGVGIVVNPCELTDAVYGPSGERVDFNGMPNSGWHQDTLISESG